MMITLAMTLFPNDVGLLHMYQESGLGHIFGGVTLELITNGVYEF